MLLLPLRQDKIGDLKCRICGEGWQSRIHYLTEPIDVYSEWLDATEAEAEAEERHETRHGAETNDGYGQEAEDLI